uniref:Uncharacterized protein n=1 Tax=Escherichia coli TaxID=562 RepID=A0A3G4RT89_ECOLX|nr:hypothetical protein D0368_00167 [Escherichia coli]
MKPETEIDETGSFGEPEEKPAPFWKRSVYPVGDICSNMGAMCSRVARSHMVSVPESAIGNRHASV